MKLRHPHIIGLREVFLTSSHLVLAMEYAAGGDLFRYVSARRGLPEDEARWFFQQLMIAVDYCHRMVRAASCNRREYVELGALEPGGC
jgi:serine/threonine-protein kinase SRK2